MLIGLVIFSIFGFAAALFFGIQNHKKALKISQLVERESHLQLRLTEGQNALGSVKGELKDAFVALASETLKGTNAEFLKIAEMKINQQQKNNRLEMENKQNQIHNIVAPLKKTLDQFQSEISAMETERQRSYAMVEGELKRVVENSVVLSKETRALKNALKKPNVRGRWGEIQLKNCVELAGMSEFADVSFHDHSVTDGKRMIPDMTVNMPGRSQSGGGCETPHRWFF